MKTKGSEGESERLTLMELQGSYSPLEKMMREALAAMRAWSSWPKLRGMAPPSMLRSAP